MTQRSHILNDVTEFWWALHTVDRLQLLSSASVRTSSEQLHLLLQENLTPFGF